MGGRRIHGRAGEPADDLRLGADRFGRKRLFLLGLAIFSLGSLLCGLAPDAGALVAFRALQAVGGSMLNPVAVSIIANTFTDRRERAPLDAVVCGLQTAADTVFEGRRDAVARRREIIDANPELHERELSKRASLTDTIAAALHARGLDSDTALLTARAGVLVHQTAMQRWTQSADDRSLRELLSEALRSLHAIVGPGTGWSVDASQASPVR
jgi:hypothetical protein